MAFPRKPNDVLRPGALRVHRPHVGYHSHLRQRKIAQERDLARHVEAHLQHRPLVSRPESQHRQRQPDLIVVVAGVSQRPVALAQHLRHYLFRRRLAHAARDSDHAQVVLSAPRPRNALQCRQRVLDPQAQRGSDVQQVLRL